MRDEFLTAEEKMAKNIIERVQYMYLKTDGTIEFPNSYDGDLLKLSYKLAIEILKK